MVVSAIPKCTGYLFLALSKAMLFQQYLTASSRSTYIYLGLLCVLLESNKPVPQHVPTVTFSVIYMNCISDLLLLVSLLSVKKRFKQLVISV